MTSIDERELVRNLVAGDDEALRYFLDHYVERLYGFLYYRLGRNAHDAEDLVQEVSVAALRSVRSFKGESGLYAWLCGLARHKLHDAMTKQQKGPRASMPIDTEVIQDHVLSDGTMTDRVSEALSALPENYQRVLVGKYIDGLSVRELSEQMETTEKSVESTLTRAREAFKNTFEEEPS